MADHVIDPHKTPIKFTIAAVLSGCALIASGGFYAGVAISRMTSRLGAIEIALTETLKQSDLKELKAETRQLARDRVTSLLSQLRFKCPTFSIRGKPMLCAATVVDDEE